jgi:ketosteroid isomerase-like protein
MKLVVGGLLAALTTVVTALPLASQPPAAERAVRALEERERIAVMEEDTAALQDIWAPALIVNNPQNEISADRNTVLGLIAAGRIRHARFDRRIEAVRIHGDVAIVMGGEIVVARVGTGPVPPPVERRFSHTWLRTEAGWQLIARHANRLPSP